MSEPIMDIRIQNKIKQWKEKLLDMTLRNKLLNFKETKKSTLAIEGPSIDILYKKLVIDEKTLKFDHLVIRPNKSNQTEEEHDNKVIKPGDIKTSKEFDELQQILKNIRLKSKTIKEEQGINTLFLAVGFLEWKDSQTSGNICSAPIILIPVVLNHNGLMDPYELSLHEDEIVINPTLLYKLESNFNIKLPEFDYENPDIRYYLSLVKSIANRASWDVKEKVSLALLSFSKINMYKDLDSRSVSISNNPIVKSLCGIETNNDINSGINFGEFIDYDHDKNKAPKDTFMVLDADSSQQDAILMASKGVSFVLQGPPGTGKSQTIVNIIAEAINAGKKVLFVSEKMAALEVVYKRLSDKNVNLQDFALVLHSTKTNKKEVLNSLKTTLELKQHGGVVSNDILNKLNTLEEDRKKLNDYCHELHQKIQPLNLSIFEINGRIAKLQNAKDILFSLGNKNIRHITQDGLSIYKALIVKYASTRELLSDGYKNNTWQNTTINNITFDLRHDIQAQLNTFIGSFPNYTKYITDISNKLDLQLQINFSNLDACINLLNFCATSPKFPKEFLVNNKLSEIKEYAIKINDSEKELNQKSSVILGKYPNSIFGIDAQALKYNVENQINSLILLINNSYSYADALITNSDYLIKVADNAVAILNEGYSIAKHIADDFNIEIPNNAVELDKFVDFVKKVNSDIRLNNCWFDSEIWNKRIRQNTFERAKEQISTIKKLRTEILNEYDKDVLSLDTTMLARFRTEYTNWWSRLFGSYRKDIKVLRALRKTSNEKLTYDTALRFLEKLKEYNETIACYNESTEKFCKILGGWFEGEETDFYKIQKSFDDFDSICEYLKSDIPEETKKYLLYSRHTNALEESLDALNKVYRNEALYEFEKIYKFDYRLNFSNSIINAERISTGISNLIGLLAPLRNSNKYVTFNEYIEDIKTIEQCKKAVSFITDERKKINLLSPYLAAVDKPVWANIIKTLEWVITFNDYASKIHFSTNFQYGIAENSLFASATKDFAGILYKLKIDLGAIVDWFASKFTQEEKIKEFSFDALFNKAMACYSKIDELEKWIDFNKARNNCVNNNLGEFITVVEEKGINATDLTSIFLKKFYRSWLDSVLPEFPSVNNFRQLNHTEIIKDFKKLDFEQLKIASARIRTGLIRAIPAIDGMLAAKDEVAILKRELGKHTKIMPIRKLFETIPNLMSKLKPCLMMSPLSVSSILKSDNYSFDLVIFDEASQVRTENAIGAISRAKQVIVAGDEFQLPPTSFFDTTTNDDFDSDSDEDEVEQSCGAYESLLKELKTILPETSLKWHYRSRDENLIAFSNRYIYDNKLVTFPSSSTDNKSQGVEFIHVENGVYDRSGRRDNVVEAQKVAEVVFDEIRKNPNRSIGVITFSAAQQNTVYEAITNMRYQCRDLEDYFNENKDNPFFVKNLENVQGDERDTIVFSIGYAKGYDGRLLMNFGPLSNNESGFRRLNVAITRAKYAVKVVSSILPTDMLITPTTSRGVRMLKDYLEFARSGIQAVINQPECNDISYTESPFEDSVLDFLKGCGYYLATQVGCSGYRIDIAIKHPTLQNRFVLGIECDGAMYHSSRTARERDRLRQSILEEMGWKIHRIWSTDWIKDPVTEGNKLKCAIDKAITNFGQAPDNNTPDLPDAGSYISPEVAATSVDLGFEDFIEVSAPFSYWEFPLERKKEKLIEIIEKQYPVHIQLVYGQIASMYGFERVTETVKNEINSIVASFNNYLWRFEKDFLWPIDKYTPVVRKNVPNSNFRRTVMQISIEEIAKGMSIVAAAACGITKEGLYAVLAREFGFARVSPQISERFDEGFAYFLSGYTFKETNDGKIVKA